MLALLALALQEPIAIPDGMLQPALAVAQSRKAAEDAQSAWEAGEAAQALGLFRTAAELRPMHGGLLVQQARAAAAAGEKEEALTALRRAAAMGFGFDLVEDEALTSLREDESFPKILAQFESNRKPLVRSEVAFRVERAGFHVEGIAHDAQTGDFYLSSFDGGEILRIRWIADSWSTRLFADLKEHACAGAYGMALDAPRRLLYVTGGASRGKPGETELGALISFELPGGAHRRTARRPGSLQLLGDAFVAEWGEHLVIFATDPTGGAVYSLGEGAFAPRLEAGRLSSPQGLVTLPAAVGEMPTLVIADYAAGLLTRRADDPASLRFLGAPEDACLLGIDGLARHGDDLIAIQNGIGVHRVLRLRLDAKHERITEVEVLERNHPEHGEPTLGVVVGNDFYSVANAPWGLAEGEEPPPAVVLRLPLN